MSGTTVRKFFQFDFDYAKEERWLNEMAARGVNPIPVKSWLGGKYELQPGEPGEWIYRIAVLPGSEMLLDRGLSDAARSYIDLVVESGAEVLRTEFAEGNIAWFRRRATYGPFELYTDLESRRTYYERVRRSLKSSTVLWAAIVLISLFTVGLNLLRCVIWGGYPFDYVVLSVQSLAIVCYLFPLIRAVIGRTNLSATVASLDTQSRVEDGGRS